MLKIIPLNYKVQFKVITKLFEKQNYQMFFKELSKLYHKIGEVVRAGNSTPEELELFCRSAAILLCLPNNPLYTIKDNIKAVRERAIEEGSFNKNFLFDEKHGELCKGLLRRKIPNV